MKLTVYSSCAYLICSAVLAAPANQSPDVAHLLATGPLLFEPETSNGPHQRFTARGPRHQFEFSENGAVFRSAQSTARMQFAGASSRAKLEGEDKLKSETNFFLGNNPAKWRRRVPNYGRLRVHEIYKGIDVIYYGNPEDLEYDLVLKPGADPRQIRLQIGTEGRLDSDGNLVADLIQKRPLAYQLASDGTRIPVKSRYRQNGDGSYGFELGPYDHTRELTIDPVLTLSVYVGGSAQNIINAIAHDANGFLYVAGITDSSDFPVAGNSSQTTYAGAGDVFVAKIDPNAQAVVYASYYGGSGTEVFGGLAVDSKGDVYITGTTASGNLPTVNPYQSSSGSTTTNAFLAWLDPSQDLVFSTYLGGSGTDSSAGITLDPSGNVWMIGSTNSPNFPMVNPLQDVLFAGQDMFVSGFSLTSNGGSLIYSTYLGGENWDKGQAIAAAPDGTLWVGGSTYSIYIETTGASLQPSYQGRGDAYLAHIDPTQGTNGVLYGTYLGGSAYENLTKIVIDPQGRAVVAGYTLSPNFPVTNNAAQVRYSGDMDAFIAILNPTLSRNAQLVYASYFGGPEGDAILDMKENASGNLYLTGYTMSAGLPATGNALQPAYDGSLDAFVLELNPAKAGSSGISYFSYLGSDGIQVGYGVDFDTNGHIFLAGETSGPIFKAFGGAPYSQAPGIMQGFVIGFAP